MEGVKSFLASVVQYKRACRPPGGECVALGWSSAAITQSNYS